MMNASLHLRKSANTTVRKSTNGGWHYTVSGYPERGGTSNDITVFGTAEQLRSIAQKILDTIPEPVAMADEHLPVDSGHALPKACPSGAANDAALERGHQQHLDSLSGVNEAAA